MQGTNTYLLRLIYDILSNEFTMNRYQFFEKITLDMNNKTLLKYIPTNKYWFTPNQQQKYVKTIKDDDLKRNIATTLGFDYSLWNERNALIQKNKIKEAIKIFLDKEDNMLKKLTLPTYKELKENLSKEEQKLLKELKKGDKEAFKRILPENMNLSQEMFLAMIVLAYKFGYYEHLVKNLFPPLKMSNRMQTEILFIYANALGSHQLKEYEEASLILAKINTEDNANYIDTQTAMTSNFLRHLLGDNVRKLSKDKLKTILYEQTKNYKIIFEKEKNYNYYPAINYAYMIAIAKHLYPKDKEFQTLFHNMKINELFKLSQKSIDIDKKDTNSDANYYATITELEFSLIRNLNITQEIGNYLDEKTPDITLVSRSLRQIIFFRDILESSVDEVSFNITRLNKVIDMINAYISVKSE